MMISELVSLASAEPRGANPDGKHDFRIDKRELAEAKAICERSGVSLGSFVRQCVKRLVAEHHDSALLPGVTTE